MNSNGFSIIVCSPTVRIKRSRRFDGAMRGRRPPRIGCAAQSPTRILPTGASFEHALDGLRLDENDAFVYRLLWISRTCVLAAQSELFAGRPPAPAAPLNAPIALPRFD